MSSYPAAADCATTVFAAVRVILECIEGDEAGGRRRAGQLIEELGKRHGPEAQRVAAVLLAEVAANGMKNYAGELDVPVDRALSQYEEFLRDDIDFELLIAEQFPESPTGD